MLNSPNDFNDLQKSIIRVILYFDIFNHPLNEKEIFELAGIPATPSEINLELEELRNKKILNFDSGYYFLNGSSLTVNRRIEKQNRSVKYQKIARLISKIINYHPFVRAVLISGSLSKSALASKDDIDFFIITQPGRLWISRSCLMFFKKVVLLNYKKFFCINYYISSDNLEIPDKNIFTATELAFMKPLKNFEVYNKFVATNGWIRNYYPNIRLSIDHVSPIKEPLLKKILEMCLYGKLGDKLDNYLLNIYRKRWQNKFGTMDHASFELNFRSEKNVSKHHPSGYQSKVLSGYERKIMEFEKKFQSSLSL